MPWFIAENVGFCGSCWRTLQAQACNTFRIFKLAIYQDSSFASGYASTKSLPCSLQYYLPLRQFSFPCGSLICRILSTTASIEAAPSTFLAKTNNQRQVTFFNSQRFLATIRLFFSVSVQVYRQVLSSSFCSLQSFTAALQPTGQSLKNRSIIVPTTTPSQNFDCAQVSRPFQNFWALLQRQCSRLPPSPFIIVSKVPKFYCCYPTDRTKS